MGTELLSSKFQRTRDSWRQNTRAITAACGISASPPRRGGRKNSTSNRNQHAILEPDPMSHTGIWPSYRGTLGQGSGSLVLAKHTTGLLKMRKSHLLALYQEMLYKRASVVMWKEL